MNLLKNLLNSFVPNVKVGYFEFKENSADIPIKEKIRDGISVLRSTGFFLVFAVVAVFIFLFISAGRDALLIVLENISSIDHFKISSLISLLVGLFLWSVSSEFGIRYSIYVTDNSGKSLSAERVEFRKTLQKIIAGSCLLLPSVLIFISLIVVQLNTNDGESSHTMLPLLITLFLVYWLFSWLTHLYFHSYEEHEKKTDKTWFFSSDRMDKEELNWTRKIYGIYNDYIFTLPKPDNYLGGEKIKLQAFADDFEKQEQTRENNFPQHKDDLIKEVRVPAGFVFERFNEDKKDKTESFRWIYSIPLSFYKNLHKQVRWIFLIAFVLLLGISLIPAGNGVLATIGAPGLLCGAFAFWIGIYTGVLYVDFALLRNSFFSLRFFLLVVFLGSSYYNNDHPVRVNQTIDSKRMAFKTHFETWFNDYKKEFDDSSTSAKAKKYPVVFICSEGGALRTGAYTAVFLEKLQAALKSDHIDITKSIYAMSGVSGGSLGLGYYNAANFLNSPTDFDTTKASDSTRAEAFFLQDFLSPIIAKMFYGDLLNLLIPTHICNFDRAIALEKSWEYAYGNLLTPKALNTFSRSFLDRYNDKRTRPIFLINTTEVETGNQCWVTNVIPGDIIYNEKRDLLGSKIHNSVNYSTAINFSSRFPLFSPGGMLSEKNACGKYKLHYVDGGYYENTGAGSMFELLTQIKADSLGKQVYPIVIYLRFSESPADQTMNINFGNEITEIVYGIYNTRSGRSNMAVQQLNNLALRYDSKDSLSKIDESDTTGRYIDEPLSEDQRQVPMNWVLSNQSMENIKSDVVLKLQNKTGTGVMPIITKCRYSFPVLK